VCQAGWWDSSRDAIDAAAIAGKVWPGNCRGIYCVPAAASPTVPVPVSARVLATSKRGNSTYPFGKALVAANESGNVPGKKNEY